MPTAAKKRSDNIVNGMKDKAKNNWSGGEMPYTSDADRIQMKRNH